MNPRLAVDDLMDGPPVNAILACELALAGGPGCVSGADVNDLGLGQFGLGVKRPTRSTAPSPALMYHVGYVVFGRAEE
jgi:hypothetical protein